MAFDFPQNPGVGTTVTNPATGITYTYAGGDVWLVADSTVAEGYATSEALNAEVTARTSADSGLDVRVTSLENAPDPVTDLSNYYAKPQTYSQAEVNDLIDNIDTGGNVNLEDYYTKDEIDNQFTLRGVGYLYLMSSFGGSVTIRQGEINTNNRIVGQVTFISMGPVDEEGKDRRDVAAGDTIELYEQNYGHFFRYEVTSVGGDGVYGVVYVGAEEDRDHPLGLGYPYYVYLYPTHINSANYYDKAASDDRFMSLKPGAIQTCQRGITFQAAIDYTGQVQYSTNVANKRYVDEQVATRATVQYVNDEVDKMASALNAETSEPNTYYGDYAPTGTRQDGDMWFDSMHLRLNIWSQGAWVNPDRNDGASLENRIAALEARVAQLEGN